METQMGGRLLQALSLCFERGIIMKKAFVFLVALTTAFSLSACNKQIVDTTWSYDRAILYLPDGAVVEGEVESWTDYEDGDQIQIKIDGKTYLVHSMNVTLIAE